VVTSAAKIGANCIVGANCFIDGIVGNYCKIVNGVSIWSGIKIEDNVFVSNGVSFSNVSIPRTYRSIPRDQYRQTLIREGVTLEINCTIAPGIEIGRGAIVGMGAVVLEDVPPKVLIHGNPAQISLKSLKNKLRKSYEKNQ
jgi:UDP-2-acetamido-3-amino-2,3-dideoxy-glucuronate N-acetyltransferase